MIATAWNDKRNVTIPPTNADLRDMTFTCPNILWISLKVFVEKRPSGE